MGVIGGLPYPEGTDKVAEGDNAIKALATAITKNPDAIGAKLGTATPGAGWANLGTGIRYLAVNGWLHVYGRMSRASGTSTSVASLPTGFAPIETFRFIANNGITLAISGTSIVIDAGNPTGATNVAFTVAYPLNGAAALADTLGNDLDVDDGTA